MKESAIKLIKGSEDKKSFLCHLNPNDFEKETFELLEHYINKKGLVCIYITADKSYKRLKGNLEKNNLDLKKFFFIDAVESEPKEKIDNVLFVTSPSNLTHISDAVKQIIKVTQNRTFVFIDSLEGLAVDNDPKDLSEFIRSLIIDSTNQNSGVICVHCGGVDKLLVNNISPFFDKTIASDDYGNKEGKRF